MNRLAPFRLSLKIVCFCTPVAMVFLFASSALAAPCETLASLKLPNGSITSAKTVAAGAFSSPAPIGSATSSEFSTLPSFCLVTATLKPSADSDIKIEVWLPISGWNGKFQAVGNGGFAGVISYAALGTAVKAGYASASTDTGHQGNTMAFALGHPEKVVDFADRAVHEMTVQSKSIVNAYYGSAPKLSFWNGCSQGGRQAITEAAKYPADFDGIVAGAAAINWMRLLVARMALNVFVHRSADSYIPPAKYALIHEAVLKECDALDGVKDGVIENPKLCHFDPERLSCKDEDGPNCLTSAQVETARAIYSPIKNPKTGAEVMPALLQPGSELGWATLAGPEPIRYSTEVFQYLVFRNPNWDWHQFNAATDMDYALKTDNGLLEYTNPNLKPFFEHGGKLLMYHGWADPQVTAMNSVNYFNDVVRELGPGVAGKSIELYMVPGMNHCSGGAGTDTFDKMAAIEEWVANGTAPSQIPASHFTNGIVDRTRPLCPYPQVAIYKGNGSTDQTANFVCKER